MRPRQNGRHFPDDIFKRIFFNQNVRIPINISLEFVPKGPINNIPALVQIMARRRPGDKPLSETMLVSLLTHICVTRPQWFKGWGQTEQNPILMRPTIFGLYKAAYSAVQIQAIALSLVSLASQGQIYIHSNSPEISYAYWVQQKKHELLYVSLWLI